MSDEWITGDALTGLRQTELRITHDVSEEIARQTDELVRTIFGTTPVLHERYKRWRKKNRHLLTCVLDVENELVGFFDIFPLTDRAGRGILSGRYGEADLLTKHILPENEDDKAKVIHLATLCCRSRDVFDKLFLAPKVTLFLFNFLMRRYPAKPGRIYTAFASKPDSIPALTRNGFEKELDRTRTKEGSDLYALRYDRACNTVDRLQRVQGLQRFPNEETSRTPGKVQPTIRTKSVQVFISHSSKDEEIAKAFVELLEVAFALQPSDIRCTSVPGYRLFTGAHASEQLREEIRQAAIFIGVLTPASIASHYVLFELGASWGLGKPTLPLLARGIGPEAIPGPLKERHASRLSVRTDIYQILDDIAASAALKRRPSASARIEAKIEAVRVASDS